MFAWRVTRWPFLGISGFEMQGARILAAGVPLPNVLVTPKTSVVPGSSTTKSFSLSCRRYVNNVGVSNGSCRESSPNPSGLSPHKVCIVWFKRDLRMDDHPGLVAAASSGYDAVIPLFVFDPVLFRGWSQGLIRALLNAVSELRKSLKAAGSDLVVRTGSSKHVIWKLAQQAQVDQVIDVFTEDELEHDLENLVSDVKAVLSSSRQPQPSSLKEWKAPLYKCQDLELLSDNYTKYRSVQSCILPPMEAPVHLPPLMSGVSRGSFPCLEELERALRLDQSQRLSPLLDGVTRQCAKSTLALLLQGRECDTPAKKRVRKPAWMLRFLAWLRKRQTSAAFTDVEQDEVIGTGANEALHALRAYLQFPQPARDDWRILYDCMQHLQRQKGTSFRPIFHTVLALGTVSLRRIHHEALVYSKRKWFSSQTVASVIDEVKLIEWYSFLLKKSRLQESKNGWHVKAWKWRGFLIQYTVFGTGPAMVLVHGFGAFWQHYRDNIRELSKCGNRVWALTMLGFGRSEKPSIVYTEHLWAELLRDFILEVVGEPVVLVGNSLGGYIASLVSGLWPPLVKSLVLMNAAGIVDPNYQTLKNPKVLEKTGIPRASSQVLLFFLQQQCASAFKLCYPSRSERVDDWIVGEALRASYDPGAAGVLESMFYLRLPLPLNFLLDQYDGATLVLQGIFDPLQNALKNARLLQVNCKNITVTVVNAGHCPHDEGPQEVNRIISGWLRDLYDPLDTRSYVNEGNSCGTVDRVDKILHKGRKRRSQVILISDLSPLYYWRGPAPKFEWESWLENLCELLELSESEITGSAGMFLYNGVMTSSYSHLCFSFDDAFDGYP